LVVCEVAEAPLVPYQVVGGGGGGVPGFEADVEDSPDARGGCEGGGEFRDGFDDVDCVGEADEEGGGDAADAVKVLVGICAWMDVG
jgi:hypothetical protein